MLHSSVLSGGNRSLSIRYSLIFDAPSSTLIPRIYKHRHNKPTVITLTLAWLFGHKIFPTVLSDALLVLISTSCFFFTIHSSPRVLAKNTSNSAPLSNTRDKRRRIPTDEIRCCFKLQVLFDSILPQK